MQESILSSARRQCTAYTRLYIHWRQLTVLLSMLNDDFSTWRLFTVDDWRLCTRLFYWQLYTTFLLVDDLSTVDNSIHDSKRLATLYDYPHTCTTLLIYCTLPLVWNSREQTRNWRNATHAFNCPSKSSNYKPRTQLAILKLSPVTCNSWSTWKRKQSNLWYPEHMLYQPMIYNQHSDYFVWSQWEEWECDVWNEDKEVVFS